MIFVTFSKIFSAIYFRFKRVTLGNVTQKILCAFLLLKLKRKMKSYKSITWSKTLERFLESKNIDFDVAFERNVKKIYFITLTDEELFQLGRDFEKAQSIHSI